MKPGEFRQAIEDYTVANSNFDKKRNYISLSHCALSVEEILAQLHNGFDDSVKNRLRCYKGYQMERDLVMRIKAIYGSRVFTNNEISGFDGQVLGHPDFTIDQDPGDCKSVLLDEWLPKDGALPRKVYYQMQGYMLYSERSKAVVIYESRESGKLFDYWIRANASIQNQIDEKLIQVIDALGGFVKPTK